MNAGRGVLALGLTLVACGSIQVGLPVVFGLLACGCDCRAPDDGVPDAGRDAAPVEERDAEGPGLDAGPDAWAGCAYDPYGWMRCLGEPTDCPPQRPFCCGKMTQEMVFFGDCMVDGPPAGATYPECILVTEPACPPPPDRCTVDRDQDGFTARMCGGKDCDDEDRSVSPGAADRVEPGRWTRSVELPEGATIGALLVGDSGTDSVTVGLTYEEGGWHYGVGTLEGGLWTVVTLDDADRMDDQALWRAPDGNLSVAYVRSNQGQAPELRRATQDGDLWTVVTVEGTCCAWQTAIAFGDGGILYTATLSDHLDVASDAGGAWTSERVIDEVPLSHAWQPLAMAIDGGGSVHLALSLSGDLLYASDQAGAWQVGTIDSFLHVDDAAIAIDRAGAAHIAYLRSSLGDLRYATNANGEWELDTIFESPWSPVGSTPSIATGPDGSLAVAAQGAGGTRQLAWRRDADWALDGMPTGTTHSMQFDRDGRLHAAWLGPDGSGGALETLARPGRADQNCDGVDGEDRDRDTHAAEASGGDDCDDAAPTVHPGAPDEPRDGIDQDCSGRDAR